nr:acyltransferase family protein [Mycobacterium sp. PS03-16]
MAVGTQDRRSAERGFRPDIEGLRAVAVLAVVLFHADVPGLRGGFVGVDVFFVISGFLITGLLWREASANGTVRLRNFYAARARRLLPASAVVGVITMIGAALLLPPLQVASVAMDGITSALYVSNYRFIGSGVNYFAESSLASPSPFQHYWSLGVEEQFYLVWPILIIGTAWLIRRLRRLDTKAAATASVRPYVVILGLVTVVSFALSLFITYLVPPVAFFSLPTRAWQLAAGGLIALTVTQWRRMPAVPAAVTGWTGLALILLACTWLSSATRYPGIAALLPTLGAVLVIGAGCAQPSRGCGRLLSTRPMGAIGRVSYSWYLWHWPVLVFTPLVVGHAIGLAGKLTAVLVAAGLAVLTMRFVEDPLRFSPRIRRSAWAGLGLGGAVTATAVCVALVTPMLLPNPASRGPVATPVRIAAATVPPGSDPTAYDAAVRAVFDQAQAAVAASVDIRTVPSNLTPNLSELGSQQLSILSGGCLLVVPFDTEQPECATADTSSATTVALIGDSRAAMYHPAFEQAATQRSWRLEMLAKASCPIVELPVSDQFNGLAEQFQRCAQWRGEILTRVQAEPPQLVVVASARAYDATGVHTMTPGLKMFDDAWLDGLSRLVQQLRDTGAQVLVLGPSVDLPMSAPLCLSAHPEDVTTCAAVRGEKYARGIAAEAAAVEAAGGRYTDVTGLFCAGDRCPVIVGNTLVYFDAGHLTREYAQHLAPAMGALADRALAHR